MKGLDTWGKQVLHALIDDPRASTPALAQQLGISVDVVEQRLGRLRDQGFLTGFNLALDLAKFGLAHEMMVTGIPTSQTTSQALNALCRTQGVTRVFTLASRHAVAFTVSGRDQASLREEAHGMATTLGLFDAQFTMLVGTLLDNQSNALPTAQLAEPTSLQVDPIAD